MTEYFIDYENVGNDGLTGIELLGKDCIVHIYYSEKAGSIKFDNVKLILQSDAKVTFDKVKNGTPNALDFQMITDLCCLANEEVQYRIISGDKGYDVAIESMQRHNLSVRRFKTIKAEIGYFENKSKEVDAAAGKNVETQEDKAKLQEVEVQVEAEIKLPEEKPLNDIPVEKAAKKKRIVKKAETKNRKENSTSKKLTKAEVNTFLMKTFGEPFNKTEIKKLIDIVTENKDKASFYRRLVSEFGMERGCKLYNRSKPKFQELVKFGNNEVSAE